MFRGKLKYLYLIPIALMLGFVVFFQYVFQEIEVLTLAEKMIEKRMDVDLLAESADMFVYTKGGWDSDYYLVYINNAVEEIDKQYSVFASTYDEDLNLVSEQSGDQRLRLLDPWGSGEIWRAVQDNEYGEIHMTYDRGNGKYTDVVGYFRWMPTDTSFERRYLVIVALYPESVVSQPHKALANGMGTLMIATAIINAAFVAILCGAKKPREPRCLGR